MVEVSPPYDDRGETTAWTAADLAFEVFGLMVGKPLYPVDGYVERIRHRSHSSPKQTAREASCGKDEL